MRDAIVVERSIEIAVPVDELFAFHLDTRNAAAVSPPGTRITEIHGRFPLQPGAVVSMRIRQRPLPLATTWRVRVEGIEPRRRIVDLAQRSPFAHWRHEHLFQSLGPGRSLLTDRISFRLPGGRLGRLVGGRMARRRLARTLEARQELTRAALEGS